MTDDELIDQLNAAFGTETLHDWPPIPHVKPGFIDRVTRTGAWRNERRINKAIAVIGNGPISDDMRRRYWDQVIIGQCVHEDAGGYKWRCWCAALGIPFEAPTLQQIIETLRPFSRVRRVAK